MNFEFFDKLLSRVDGKYACAFFYCMFKTSDKKVFTNKELFKFTHELLSYSITRILKELEDMKLITVIKIDKHHIQIDTLDI